MQKYLADRPFTLENCLIELARLKVEGKTPSTRASVVSYIRRMCDFFLYQYNVPSFADKLPRIKVPPTVADTLSSEEIKLLYTTSQPPSRDALVYNLFIETLARTGRRISEIQKLQVRDLDFSDSTFLLRDPKNHESRRYPLPTDLSNRLKPLCDNKQDESSVFTITKKTGGFWTTTAIKSSTVRSVLIIRKRFLHIRGRVSPHVLRHSYPVELLRRKVPLPLVSELLGHKTWSATKRYTHLVLDDMRSASNFHPLNQENLEITDVIESIKKDVSRYKLVGRKDMEFEIREGQGIYELRIRW
jgi:integrase/recombinase XerD